MMFSRKLQKKVVRPSQRKEMGKEMTSWAVEYRGLSTAGACRTFQVNETCYRYKPRLSDENERVADWLITLTKAQRTWGFSLCFLYLRNVRGFIWNHKRVYRIYRELELNMLIKPGKRLKRDKPEPLSVLDDFNREGLDY